MKEEALQSLVCFRRRGCLLRRVTVTEIAGLGEQSSEPSLESTPHLPPTPTLPPVDLPVVDDTVSGTEVNVRSGESDTIEEGILLGGRS